MEDNTILDSQLSSAGNRITSLSSQRIKLDATKARLNGPYDWSVNLRFSPEWLQIYFTTQVTITGILTQGSGYRPDQWVKTMKIARTIGTGTTLYYISGEDNTEVSCLIWEFSTIHRNLFAAMIHVTVNPGFPRVGLPNSNVGLGLGCPSP